MADRFGGRVVGADPLRRGHADDRAPAVAAGRAHTPFVHGTVHRVDAETALVRRAAAVLGAPTPPGDDGLDVPCLDQLRRALQSGVV